MKTKSGRGQYRLLDLTDEKGAYATRILADLGMDVIKVEPPQGDRMRSWPPFFGDDPGPENSLYFLFYNLNKRSITLDLRQHDGRDIFRRLVEGADAVVESFAPGHLERLELGYDVLRQMNPALVMASITHFGQSGPQKDYESSDLVDMSLGGMLQMTGEPSGSPPLRFGIDHAYCIGSLYGALGIVSALYHRHTLGEGQYVGISILEATTTLSTECAQAQTWFTIKENPSRGPLKAVSMFPGGFYETQDGWTIIACLSPGEWDRWAQWYYEVTGNEEMLDPMYKGHGYSRTQYTDYLIPLAEQEFFPKLTKAQCFHEGQRRGLVLFPVVTIEELVNDPQLNSRGFFVDVDCPAGKAKLPKLPYYCSEMPWQVYRSAPSLGEHNQQIYCGELGLSRHDLVTLKASGII